MPSGMRAIMQQSKNFLRKVVRKVKQISGWTSPVAAPQYPVVQKGQDAYEVAYKWGWESGRFKELIYLCYKTPDNRDNVQRFFESREFSEIRKILGDIWHTNSFSGKRALDFACGNGFGAYSLSRIGFDVVAMDSSVSEIAGLGAAKKVQGFNGASFQTLHSKGETLPFEDNAFDLIWIREGLHHMHDLPKFMKDISRILKPGGIILGLREQVIWNEEQRQFMYDHHPFYPITKDEGCYYLHEYVSAFERAGLTLVHTLNPAQSPINYYPATTAPSFDEKNAASRKEGWDIYTFIAVKPNG